MHKIQMITTKAHGIGVKLLVEKCGQVEWFSMITLHF